MQTPSGKLKTKTKIFYPYCHISKTKQDNVVKTTLIICSFQQNGVISQPILKTLKNHPDEEVQF